MQVVDPTGVVPEAVESGDAWQLDVRGQTIGILWNGKPNADNMFRIIEQRLIADYGIAGTLWQDKQADASGPAMPGTPEQFDKLSSGAIAVLVGSGD